MKNAHHARFGDTAGCRDGSCGGGHGHLRHGQLGVTEAALVEAVVKTENCAAFARNCVARWCRFGNPYGGAIPHTAQQPGQSGIAPQYAYPYYTTRGPRDFLRDNPPSIGR